MRSWRFLALATGLAALLIFVWYVVRGRSRPDVSREAASSISRLPDDSRTDPSSSPSHASPRGTTAPAAGLEARERALLTDILGRVRPLLGRTSLSKDEMRLWQALRVELSRAAWETRSSILEMLRLSAEIDQDPQMIDFIEEAIGPRIYSTAQLLERAPLDPESTDLMAKKFLSEKTNPGLKRLYLMVLRCDLQLSIQQAGIDRKKVTYRLDEATLAALLAEVRDSRDYALVDYALFLAGPYSDRSAAATSFLEGLIQNPLSPQGVRLSALSTYATGRLNKTRFELAQTLLRQDGGPEIRRAALKLLFAPVDREMPESLRLATVELLKSVAERERDPELRAVAVDTLVKMGRNDDAIATAARLIDAESEPAWRARYLQGFRDATFQTRELTFTAQDLMIRVFQSDSSEVVRESAVDCYLQLIRATIVDQDNDTVDLRTIGGIERMVSILVGRPPGEGTKQIIRKRLATEFEKVFPDLIHMEQYKALKRSLEK